MILRPSVVPLRKLLLVACGTAGLSAQSPAPSRVTTTAPVQGYSVSFFSDEGYPKVRVDGDSANVANPERIVLTGMKLTLLKGDASRAVDSTVSAPTAVLEPQSERVTGADQVALIRTDLELTGEDWSYDHRAREIHIRRNARMVFHSGLDDLLQ